MAWTAPRTWTTAEVVTASHMNTHVRDNLLETAPNQASASGELIVSAGSKSVAARQFNQDTVTTNQNTTSTSYTDLTTSGPAVTVTTGTNALVIVSAEMSNQTAGKSNYMDFAVSGATSRSAGDSTALRITSSATTERYAGSRLFYITAITGGSNTFTAKYRVDGGTGNFLNRRIMVLGL